MTNTLLNILWLLFGGLLTALGWFLFAVLLAITILGIPWSRASWNIGLFVLWPFGMQSVDRGALSGRADIGTGCLGLLGNVIWFLLAGVWLFLGHLASAILCAVTIIGIPFALQHLKIGIMALAPIGKSIADIRR